MDNENSIFKIIVIDNFYDNPMEVREFALKQEYFSSHLPIKHTRSFATKEHLSFFQKIIKPFGGKITSFYDSKDNENGSFQYSTSDYTDWVHINNNDCKWIGIIYLTPNAPISSGTSFYKFTETGAMNRNDEIRLDCENMRKEYSKDVTKWELVDNIGNIFNRLIIYDSTYYHKANNYFGTDINDGCLFQIFFFDTEY